MTMYYARLELGLLHVEELLDEPAPLIGRPPLLGVQDPSSGDVKPQPPFGPRERLSGSPRVRGATNQVRVSPRRPGEAWRYSLLAWPPRRRSEHATAPAPG
eukprot:scaffold122145_cov30-Phaeocystis_antarctica.AAC.2